MGVLGLLKPPNGEGFAGLLGLLGYWPPCVGTLGLLKPPNGDGFAGLLLGLGLLLVGY